MKVTAFFLRSILLAVSLVASLAYAFFPRSLYAADISVNTTDYGNVADSECSLVEAIIAANTNTAANGCPAGDDSPTDTIVLATDASYFLTDAYEFDEREGYPFAPPPIGTGLPGIRSTLIISGNGATIERSGSQMMRLMLVGCGGNLTLLDVTLRYGSAEGVKSEGILVVKDSHIDSNLDSGISVSSCESGSVLSRGSLVVENSHIGSNGARGLDIFYNSDTIVSNSEITANSGGGIFSSFGNTLIVTDSTVSANQGDLGGALLNRGSATIVNSSLISNTASRGGAVFNGGPGSTLVISDTDMVANFALEAGGALYQDFGASKSSDFRIVYSRILDNRAGQSGSVLYTTGNFGTIHESCIVGNTPVAVNHAGGPRLDATKNWWGSPTGPGGSGPGIGDSVSEYVIFDDFQTNAILGCPSRAPDLTTYLPTVAREKVGRTIIVDTSTDFDVGSSDSNCTLIEAILAANTDTPQDQCPAGHAGHDVIVLAEGATYSLQKSYADYDGLTGLPIITSTITIYGNGATIERSSNEQFRFLRVTGDGKLILHDVTLRNGSGVDGGAIYNRGTLILDNSRILSNTASLNGGGIFNDSVLNFVNNELLRRGGTVITYNGTRIAFNRAERGGGIFTQDLGELSIVDTEIVLNHAVEGGSIYNKYSTVTLTRVRMVSNTASEHGGGVFSAKYLTIYDSDFIANTAGQTGGALYQASGLPPFFNTTLVHIYHSRLLENEAAGGGSALQLTGSAFALVHQNCIVGNSTVAVAAFQPDFPLNVIYNWWGSSSGPAGEGLGSGDEVGQGIMFSPFLTELIMGCPSSTSTD